MSQMNTEVESITTFTYEELADKLKLNGIMLAPGNWKGIDYRVEDIKAMYDSYGMKLEDLDMVVEHGYDPDYAYRQVGGHDKVIWDDNLKAVVYQSIIEDPDAIDDVKSGKFRGTSLKIKRDIVLEDGKMVAKNLVPLDNSLTRLPACKSCVITSYEEMSKDGKHIEYLGIYDTDEIKEALKEATCNNHSIMMNIDKELSNAIDTIAGYFKVDRSIVYGIKEILSNMSEEDCSCAYELSDTEELSVLTFGESHWDLPKADMDRTWSFSSKDYTIEQLQRACIIYQGDKDNKTSYKLPHHLPDGTVVWHGVDAAIKSLKGARGGVDASEEDKKRAFAHLNRHAKAFGKEVEPLSYPPKTDAERAKEHFDISDEEWNKLTEEEKKEYIAKLPTRGTRYMSNINIKMERDNGNDVEMSNEFKNLEEIEDDELLEVKRRIDEEVVQRGITEALSDDDQPNDDQPSDVDDPDQDTPPDDEGGSGNDDLPTDDVDDEDDSDDGDAGNVDEPKGDEPKDDEPKEQDTPEYATKEDITNLEKLLEEIAKKLEPKEEPNDDKDTPDEGTSDVDDADEDSPPDDDSDEDSGDDEFDEEAFIKQYGNDLEAIAAILIENEKGKFGNE